jgi:uncharacterized protein (TIGR02466 family)
MIKHFFNAIPIATEHTSFLINQKENNYLNNINYVASDNVHKVKISKKENLLENKQMKRIKTFILTKVEEYKKNVLQIKNELKLTQSWSTVNTKKTFHHSHMHPNTFISLVYYVKSNGDGGNLVFEIEKTKLQEGFNFNYTIDKYNEYNSLTWTFKTQTGMIAIFPGWLRHHTTPFEGEKRIVIGANFFVTGVIGSEGNTDLINLKC